MAQRQRYRMVPDGEGGYRRVPAGEADDYLGSFAAGMATGMARAAGRGTGRRGRIAMRETVGPRVTTEYEGGRKVVQRQRVRGRRLKKKKRRRGPGSDYLESLGRMRM